MKHDRRRCGTERFESKETRIRRDCVDPADHLVENGASFMGYSAVLLGGLVDAVCDDGSEGGVHALRCQVAYLQRKVNAQASKHDRGSF